MQSLKKLYKVGIGPSSSHTMGPQYAAEYVNDTYPEADFIRVILYGSLALTGEGHGTDTALSNTLKAKNEIIFNTEESDLPHPNTLDFYVFKDGEEIAKVRAMSIGGGDVKIKLFPEETPKGVENFKKLVESGFYDELIFHRVVDSFVIQGGDPRGNGTGGVDAWGSNTGFEQTISGRLCHVTGAVAYAIGQDKLNKSQFYIVTGQEITSDYLQQLRDAAGISLSPELTQLYQNAGGQPFLDGGYEVFGQVFDGLEHCLAIQKVAVDGEQKPKTPVVIEKAIITEYDGTVPHWYNAAGEEISVSSD